MTTAGFVDWAVFWTVVGITLVADIVVARLGGRTPTVRNATLWSGTWIGLGLLERQTGSILCAAHWST